MSRPNANATALILALVAATAAFWLSPAPHGLASFFAGTSVTALSSEGGYRIAVVAEGASPAELELLEVHLRERALFLSSEVRTSRDGKVLLVDIAGIDKSQAEGFADLRASGARLRFQMIAADTDIMRLIYAHTRESAPTAIEPDIDQWVHDETGRQFTDYFLTASSREELTRYLAQIAAEDPKLALPPEYMFGFENSWSYEQDRGVWRSYVLSRDTQLVPLIADARVDYNPYTNRPEVLIDFHEDSGRAFAELTGALVGEKLAILIGDTISSAPTVQSRIDGGSVSISLGGNDPNETEQEAARLVQALRIAPPPVPAKALGMEALKATTAGALWFTRALLAMLLGALVFASTILLFPWLTIPRPALPAKAQHARSPWLAAAVSVAGIAGMVGGFRVLLPGVDKGVVEYLVGSAPLTGYEQLSVFSLGLLPFISASVLVELIAFAVPRWRRLRIIGPEGRGKLDRATAMLGTCLALIQGFFVATWLEGLGRSDLPGALFDAVFVAAPGWQFRIVTMLTLTAGSLVLLVLAMLISRRGLGNGFAVLLLFGLSHTVIRLLWPGASYGTTASSGAIEMFLLVALATLTVAVLLVRVGAHESHRGLRIPTSGILPISWAPSLLLLIALFAELGLQAPLDLAVFEPGSVSLLVVLAALVVLTAVFSILFTRCYRPARKQLAAAIFASTLFLLVLATIQAVNNAALSGLVLLEVVLVTAIVMDLVAEWRARARRNDWVAVWPMHRIVLVDSALDALRKQGIDAFVRGAYFRSLLQFFGPFVPATVFVPEQHLTSAHEMLSALLLNDESLPGAHIEAHG